MASLPRSEDSNLPTSDTNEDPKPLTESEQRALSALLIQDVDDAVMNLTMTLWENILKPLSLDRDLDKAVKRVAGYRGMAWLKILITLEKYQALEDAGYTPHMLNGRVTKITRRKPNKKE